jgi:hypothetical protein
VLVTPFPGKRREENFSTTREGVVGDWYITITTPQSRATET